MKRLHRMIIGAYWGPFVITFLIVLFIFSMQWLWKWVDEFMGKGLPWDVLIELIIYATCGFIPLVLPLAVLLSSIMTMGGLGEHSELTPMRSAGLGLGKIIRPLVVFTLLIAGFSFFFSNNLLPVINLKSQSLLWDVTKKKPAITLKAGVFFNGIDGFSMRVGEKNETDGTLRDVLIYDHREAFQANRTVVRAKRGNMQRSLDGQYMLLTLEDGVFYDERDRMPGIQGGSEPLVRGSFKQELFRLDLSGLGLQRTDEDLFKDHYKMLTLGQLDHTEDSLQAKVNERKATQEHYLRNALWVTRDSVKTPTLGTTAAASPPLSGVSGRGTYEMAQTMLRSNLEFVERSLQERNDRTRMIAKFRIEWHRKVMLAFACVVFFLIGAPLGAIIRKGGMGLPTVFAIIFFLIFHVISFSTEKLVVAGEIGAWPGMWISTFVLLPVGLWLLWTAATDSPLLDRDAYYRGWSRLRRLFIRNAHPPTVQ
ncbi:MAG: LptF/LptG family permease [Flavobacteriales bacterium]|nr:LptF/LptG family permease [Flavobacteriales bacterium]